MPRVVLFLVALPNRLIVRNNSLKGQQVGTPEVTVLHCTFASQVLKLYYWIARYVHIIFKLNKQISDNTNFMQN